MSVFSDCPDQIKASQPGGLVPVRFLIQSSRDSGR